MSKMLHRTFVKPCGLCCHGHVGIHSHGGKVLRWARETRVHASPPEPIAGQPSATDVSAHQLFHELREGQLLIKAKQSFPAVPWGAAQIAQVLGGGTALLLCAALLTTPGIIPAPSVTYASEEQAAAVAHAGRELLLCAATSSLLCAALRSSSPRSSGLFTYQVSQPWLVATACLCLVVFPLADPVLTNATTQTLTLLLGTDPAATSAGSRLADDLRACVASGDVGSLGLHVLAGGLLAPLWEETFWRGFVLTSMTRVLPLSACVALSSSWFALLHLTPNNMLPIWLLAACSDCLYLRSNSLGPPLMLHCLWNTSQMLAVAYLGKQYFV